MQFKSILLLAASATLAIATHTSDKYIVGNCGDPSGLSSYTKDACKAVEGEYCGEMTGMKRCVIREDKWDLFQKECKDDVFDRPGSYDFDDAKIMALC